MRGIVHGGAVATLFLAAAVGLFPAGASSARAEVTCVERRLTFDAVNQEVPRVSGGTVTWSVATTGAGSVPRIVSHDLATGATIQLPLSAGSYTSQHDLFEGKVVWSRNTWEDIFLYDIATGTERRLSNAASHQARPAIDGNNVVWEDYRSGGAEVYLYDIASGTEHLVSSVDHDAGPNNALSPAVHKNIVAWQGMSGDGSGWDIYVYDMGPDETFGTADDLGERRIVAAPGTQAQPVVHEGVVAWMDDRNDAGDFNWDVYYHDLATGVETRATTDPKFQGNPVIHGNVILFEDLRNGNVDIYGYDLRTDFEFEVVVAPSTQSWADVYRNTVVWNDWRHGNGEIYLAECSFGQGCDDADEDGLCDDEDACPADPGNDADGDGICESADNCPLVANPDQADFDGDGSGDACDADDDDDDVDDGGDGCLETPPGVAVDEEGCSIDDRCPCDGEWKNHGGYVSCVAHAAAAFLEAGLVDAATKGAIVSEAARSDCGGVK